MGSLNKTKLYKELALLHQKVAKVENDLGLQRSTAISSTLGIDFDNSVASLIANYSADFISIHSPNGDYLFASPSVERILGYQPRYLIGKSAYCLIHPDDLETIAEDHAAHEFDDSKPIQYRIRSSDGKYRWVETRSSSRKNGNEVEKIICITRDIDDRVKAEDDLKKALGKLEKFATYDSLTSIYNRRVITELLKGEISKFKRNDVPVSIGLVDIDHFKFFNDNYGHAIGDRVIQGVVQTIKEDLRQEDVIGRWGGEEFLIIWTRTDIDEAVVVANRIKNKIQLCKIDNKFDVTVSIGVAEITDIDDIDSLVERADKNLYVAKDSGRNCVVSIYPDKNWGVAQQ